MPKITGSAPVLLVRDVVASANYFRDAIGFDFQLWGEPPNFCISRRDGYALMLAQLPAGKIDTPYWKTCSQMWNAYFWVDDARALYDEFVTKGAKIDYHLGVKPYGILEFGIQDLDDHDIGFGQLI